MCVFVLLPFVHCSLHCCARHAMTGVCCLTFHVLLSKIFFEPMASVIIKLKITAARIVTFESDEISETQSGLSQSANQPRLSWGSVLICASPPQGACTQSQKLPPLKTRLKLPDEAAGRPAAARAAARCAKVWEEQIQNAHSFGINMETFKMFINDS